MEQKLLASTDLTAFKVEVNNALNEGWRVVPGTLQVSAASTSYNRGSDHYSTPIISYACVVVVEKQSTNVL